MYHILSLFFETFHLLLVFVVDKDLYFRFYDGLMQNFYHKLFIKEKTFWKS